MPEIIQAFLLLQLQNFNLINSNSNQMFFIN
jgi:hypothetical protein